jgi:hypothetical protein
MTLNGVACCTLLVASLTVACTEPPTAVDQTVGPLVKRTKVPDCVTSPTATLTLVGSVRIGGEVTICAQKDQGMVSGTWSASPSYGGAILDLVPPAPTADDPAGSWCVQMDYSATTDDDLVDKNAFTWIRDIGNGAKKSLDEIATRRVDAAGASCATELPPPIPPAPCVDDPSVIGIECFTPVRKGDFRGTTDEG